MERRIAAACTSSSREKRRITSPLKISMRRRHFQKLVGRQRAPRKPRLIDRTLEMVFQINANSHGRMARPLRNQVHTALALQFIAYIVPERSAIVHSSDPIPLSQRMQLVAI